MGVFFLTFIFPYSCKNEQIKKKQSGCKNKCFKKSKRLRWIIMSIIIGQKYVILNIRVFFCGILSPIPYSIVKTPFIDSVFWQFSHLRTWKSIRHTFKRSSTSCTIRSICFIGLLKRWVADCWSIKNLWWKIIWTGICEWLSIRTVQYIWFLYLLNGWLEKVSIEVLSKVGV